ncbi:hypothetical protein [Raineyella sp. LH-20]|uniref:hypothetical protein n=1 Tax=Raineyella sp. LH-20 TaxID=3081204 RepID=UPI002955B2A7|nr:hypothetical protein [Raineyella sp. LH-20]WOP18918.1 hypothetical protein R0146_01180 [Raineyella sp. LH-20]
MKWAYLVPAVAMLIAAGLMFFAARTKKRSALVVGALVAVGAALIDIILAVSN